MRQNIKKIINRKVKVKLFFIIMNIIIALFLINLAIAQTGNSKTYNPESKEYIIKDISNVEIAKVKLNTPVFYQVLRGKNRLVAEFEIESYEELSNVFNSMEFYDLNKGNKKISRNFKYKYVDSITEVQEPIYYCDKPIKNKTSCNYIYNTKYIKNWKDLDTFKKISGKITIGIFTDVQAGDTIEWIPTILNNKLTEWAVWSDALEVGLLSYWNLDVDGTDYIGNKDMTPINNPVLLPANSCKSNRCYNFTGTNFLRDGNASSYPNVNNVSTINLWFKAVNPSATSWLFSYGLPVNFKDRTIYITPVNTIGTGTASGALSTVNSTMFNNSWHMLSYIKRANDTIETYLDGSIANQAAGVTFQTDTTASSHIIIGGEGSETANFTGSIDEVGIWNRTLTQAEINDLWNNGAGIFPNEINFTLSPLNNTKTIYNSINFSAENITNIGGNLVNATLFVWYNNNTLFNSTTNLISGILNNTSWNISNFKTNNYIWNAYICSNSQCIWNTYNYTLIINNVFVENSQTFSSTAYQSSNEEFKINLTYDSNYSALGTLYYNGTGYTGSSTTSNGNTIISKTLPITSSYIGTQTFYWTIALTNSSGTYYFNSTFNNQTIAPIKIQICNATFNVSYINFSVKDMEDYSVLNSSFKATFTMGSYVYSFQDTSQTNSSFAFCFDPSDKNYTVSAKLEFEKTGYAKNYYYLTNATLTNQTTNISLYLLNASKSYLTLFKTINRGQQAIPNIYIQIQKYDVGTDTYYTVSILKTDYNGQDLVYLNWYDTFYRAILIQNGSVIKTTSPYKIFESPQEFTILDNLAFEYDKFGNIVYSLTFNNVTNNFILTYTLPSGEVTSACLRVIRRSAYNDTTICNTCETSSSATIYCNINAYGNGTYIGSFYATGSLSFIETIQTVIGVTNQIYDLLGNQDGTIYAFLFAGIILVMFMITPVLAIVGIILGVLGGMAMGFQPFNFVEFIGIIVIGGIIIWILKG